MARYLATEEIISSLAASENIILKQAYILCGELCQLTVCYLNKNHSIVSASILFLFESLASFPFVLLGKCEEHTLVLSILHCSFKLCIFCCTRSGNQTNSIPQMCWDATIFYVLGNHYFESRNVYTAVSLIWYKNYGDNVQGSSTCCCNKLVEISREAMRSIQLMRHFLVFFRAPEYIF